MKYQFQHTSRLINHKQFKQVFKEKQTKINGGVFTFFYCNNDFSYPRLGIVIPKKSINKASKRNRFKRIIKEWFRLNRYKFRNLDIVVFFNISKQKKISKEEIKEVLEKYQERFYV